MGSPGFNVSRELLLAIRQANSQRVEFLVEGFTSALREARLRKGSAKFEGSLWDLACAVQRLAQQPLGAAQFWEEVAEVVKSNEAEMQPRELALFCHSLRGQRNPALAPLLLRRAAALREDLTARDLQMILQGLEGLRRESTDALNPKLLESLARRLSQLRLDPDQPWQAANMLHAFARLRHVNDSELCRKIFDFAQEGLGAWGPKELAVLCDACAELRQGARRSLAQETWQSLALRGAEVCVLAGPKELADLARGFMRAGVPRELVAPFFEALEDRLTSPAFCEHLSAWDLCFLAKALAHQRCPVRPERPQREPHREMRPYTSWPLEEYVGRRVRDFSQMDLCSTLNAAMRLRVATGRGPELLQLWRRLDVGALSPPQVALLFSAAAAADAFGDADAGGARPAFGMLRKILPQCRALSSLYTPWQLAYISQALEVLGDEHGLGLWPTPGHGLEVVEPLCARAQEVVADEEKRRLICESLRKSRIQGLFLRFSFDKYCQGLVSTMPAEPPSFDSVSMSPGPGPGMEMSRSSEGPARASNSQNRLVQYLQTAAHPMTCVFHAAFKLVVLLVYIYGRYVDGSYVSTFILCTIFAALDFWTVKNISGRLLVGLRWWNLVKDDGSSEWVFESNPDEGNLNATDRNVFWGVTYVWPVLWGVFLFMNILNFSLDWVLLNVMMVVFAGTNLAGYWKCSTDAKKRAQQWVESQGMRAVAGAMGFA
ncbi:unnamed protein product [Effrenium voratum]|uniref:Golgi apparatus membrane protein TVP23 homolog n=1 Tax=Effrenium voratum TaxID=2562239 RepID=A0AA36IHQ4_9DINO|nr:unnamed protein product [Effrenium voratum]